MHFKRLEIFGFKSFADKTILNFEPGITAIVGPNGCGKSNIFDSIRWVLGEQSVKELRGSSMEDVIFNGTEKKPSLGFAEVSLVFSNELRALAIDDNEVMITRRLFRSGESEYLLNKTVVRLKDIQELLMGTGLGSEAYSLVQQGRVDSVVQAKPEERRLILDEASGISKYKAKKREALSKLKETEDNLLRVNDIIVEVKRQISSIERQADKARKYKEEFEKLKGLDIQLARHQLGSFLLQKERLGKMLGEFNEEESALSQKLQEQKNLVENENYCLEQVVAKINTIHTEDIKLDSQIDLNTRQIQFNEERLQNLLLHEERLKEQKIQLIERCKLQQDKIEGYKQSLSSLKENLSSHDQSLKNKKDSLHIIERLIREAREKITANEEKILILTAQQVNIRNTVTDMMKEIQGALARKRRLELENDKVSVEKQEIDEKLGSMESQIHQLKQNIEELTAQKQNKNKILEEFKAQLKELEQTLDELEKKRLFLKSQKEFIEKLHVQYQDMPDPVVEGRLILSSQPLPHHTGIIGKVKETRAHNPAENLNNPLYEIICETKFIELDPREVSHKIEEISQEITNLSARREFLLKNIQEETNFSQEFEQQILSREKNCSILEAQRNDVGQEVRKLTQEIELVSVELMEVKESLASLKKKEDEFNFQLDTINQDISWQQIEIKGKQGFITSKLQEKEETTVSIAQLETEMTAYKDKVKAQQENLKMVSESLDNGLEEIKKMDDEIATHVSKKENYEEEMKKCQAKIEETKQGKGALKVQLRDFENEKGAVGQRIHALEEQIHSLEDQLEQAHQKRHALQMEEQQIGFNEESIINRLSQTYKMAVEELKGQLENLNAPQEAQEPVSLEDLQKETDRLRKRCDSFGSVNLVAIEEYEQLKERFEFLTKQQSDLLEAKSQLMSTITKINRSTHQIFMDTFTKVNEEFKHHFRLLFGGGDAQLILLDPENALESGVEIVARPPGKKLQNISLLSGGENSLTAIALIFGIFKVNPSPFCVLDEIDAALDESNVGRFGYLLKEFVKITQFLVITHNKKTIATADVMYGITMPETGVSRIVSVKFADQEKQREVEEGIPAGV